MTTQTHAPETKKSAEDYFREAKSVQPTLIKSTHILSLLREAMLLGHPEATHEYAILLLKLNPFKIDNFAKSIHVSPASIDPVTILRENAENHPASKIRYWQIAAVGASAYNTVQDGLVKLYTLMDQNILDAGSHYAVALHQASTDVYADHAKRVDEYRHETKQIKLSERFGLQASRTEKFIRDINPIGLLEKFAELGQAKAQYYLGRLLYKSENAADKTRGITLLRSSADQGYIEALAHYANILINNNDQHPTKTAKNYLELGMSLFDGDSYFLMGECFEKGYYHYADETRDENLLWAAQHYSDAAFCNFKEGTKRAVLIRQSITKKRQTEQEARLKRERERFQELDNLTGLAAIKTRIKQIAEALDVATQRAAAGKETSKPTLNLMFAGNPGTGKTDVAKCLAPILHRIGYLEKNTCVIVTAGSLASPYRGGVEENIRNKITEAMGGVLLIDEAYQLIPKDGSQSQGRLALDIIMQAMEDHRGKIVFIFAGYKADLSRIFDHNPGLAGRINLDENLIEFPDYSVPELQVILVNMLEKQGYHPTEGAKKAITAHLNSKYNPPPKDFSNARAMRNLADTIIQNRAKRHPTTGDDISETDIPLIAAKSAGTDNTPIDINKMIGLSSVKKQIAIIEAGYKAAQIRRSKGIAAEVPRASNMLFLGPPGVGKTTVARGLAAILAGNGALKRNYLHEVSRGQLVAQYVGQTAPKVEEAFNQASGGILFIDEAYSLCNGPQDQFGLEAVGALVSLIENRRDDVVVILAGYENKMNEFLALNDGLASRFEERIIFEPYKATECLFIFKEFAAKQNINLTPDVERQILMILASKTSQPNFDNARTVRNMVKHAKNHMDLRIVKSDNADDLTTLTVEDLAGL